MTVLVLAEHDQKQLKASSFNTVKAATELGDVHVLVLGSSCASVVEQAQKLNGVSVVLHLDHEVFLHTLAEAATQVLVKLAPEYTHVLAPASSFGKNILPRAAALLDVAPLSDVVKIESASVFVRPIYAGNVLARVETQESIKLLTIRTTAFDAAELNGNASAQAVDFVPNFAKSSFVKQTLTVLERPELGAAKIIVSGGRALGSEEQFKAVIDPLADAFGAAVGASRAAVDAGYAPNDYQVGQTGKVVAPQLYIAVGISGAIQHLAGMKDSKVIVAINKDEEAPIFQVADYGLVGDLFKLVPELLIELKK